jgi:hypothetical protein
VCVCARARRARCFINDLENCQNYILWWRRWKTGIPARTFGGIIMTHLSGYYCAHHKPNTVCPEVRPVQEWYVLYSWKFINSSRWRGNGLADRRIVFQFPAEAISSHILQSVHNRSWGQLASFSTGVGVSSVLRAWCEVTTYFSQVARLNKRGAISPLPTCIRL